MKQITIKNWHSYGKDYMFFSGIVDKVKEETGHSTIIQVYGSELIFLCNKSWEGIVAELKKHKMLPN